MLQSIKSDLYTLLHSWGAVQNDVRLYNLAQNNVSMVNPVQFPEGYASTNMSYQANTLRAESASGTSLVKIHPKIEISCQGFFH